MTFPLIDTVAGRTLLVLVCGLILSHVLSIAFYVSDRRSTINLVGGEHISERMLTLARLIESAPVEEREKVARLASRSVLAASLGPAPLVEELPPANREEKILTAVFAEHLVRHGIREFRLNYRDVRPGDPLPESGSEDGPHKLMQVSLRLQDGGWLNCSAIIATSSSIWSPRFLLSMLVMTVAVIIVSAIVVYHINRPLRTFAGAAHRLGMNINAPPLPVRGPLEVREAITAFNDMQRRLRRLIANRREMLAAVSHDLRTPITLLRLRAEYVRDEEERQKMLLTLADMEAMVDSILGFVREDAADEDVLPVDLAALLKSICDDVTDLGGKAGYRGPEKFVYPCRPTVLKRALTNVIDNAVNFGGRADVELGHTDGLIEIRVEDEGPGIPDTDLETVFEPFHRVEGSRSRDTGGVGLGLSVARGIIDAHGGKITLRNRPQGGLRAEIELPLPKAVVSRSASSSRKQSDMPARAAGAQFSTKEE